MSAPHSILIVRLGAMGDILHAMPAVAALRKALPDAHFGWLAEKRWAELLHDAADVAHTADTRRWRRSPISQSTGSEFREALREIRERGYDVAIDFQGAVKSAVFARLSRAPRRFGFERPLEWPASLFYTNGTSTAAAHVVDRNFDLGSAAAGVLGVELDRKCEAPLPGDPAADSAADEKLKQIGIYGPFAILNPGAGWGAKQWPAGRHAKVARALGEGGIRSLVNFGPGEETLAKIVGEQAGGYAIASRFSISELIAITRRAS
ncbi:MAG: glycosyltransferase family 9 protein, partial [Bryobacteraceae bacterium]